MIIQKKITQCSPLVPFHLSHVTCHNLFSSSFLKFGRANRLRVCYQWGRPCLVFLVYIITGLGKLSLYTNFQIWNIIKLFIYTQKFNSFSKLSDFVKEIVYIPLHIAVSAARWIVDLIQWKMVFKSPFWIWKLWNVEIWTYYLTYYFVP